MSYESVQEMFTRAAAAFPARPAVERGVRAVTYATLEAESNRLANFLLDGGAAAGTIVGLFLYDPARVIASILGVLKAGAVFVPLDPTFPEQRLVALAEQVSPAWYVTEAKHIDKLRRVCAKQGAPARVICLDKQASDEVSADGMQSEWDYAEYDHTGHPGLVSDPDAPCSIYFTSGSTGKPKAILGRLKGIDHFIRWEIETVGACPGTKISQLASPSFDGFLKDAFVPLCSGGVVCAPESREVVLDAWSLADWLDAESVEVLHCVPSVFRALVNQGLNSSYFKAMRCVVLTGEPLYPADVKRWMDVFSDRIRLWNIYGTTETTLSKLVYEVKPADVERLSIPVGHPIRGSAVMVMDSALQPCHEGTVGEIYIRTPYRSHGYYGEPELTREVFVPNPFTDDPSDLIHRTGDFGRLLEDGSLDILGRRDQQVKVRGVRVELGEIENLLRGHEGVADVAVVDRDDAEGSKLLVAYVTLMSGTGTEALRQYLSERLPEAMMPSAFVELEQLPRTLNGKIDRKALPSLESVQASRSAEEMAGRGPIEEIVAGIWREVLRLSSVGRNDNFFNLGGHSLIATQVILRVRDILKVELPVRSMFEASTVAQLSQLIQEQIGEGRQSLLTPIEPAPRENELPLSFAQRRLWFQEELARGTTTFHISLGVRLKGPLNEAALEQALGEIIRRHENLRTSFPLVGSEPVQRISPPSRLSIPIIDLRNLHPEDRESAGRSLAEAELERPFDLKTGPLVRLFLIRHSEEDHAMLCTLHHIISDGWSKGLLVKEFSTLYEAFSSGEPSLLSELRIQYADFAAWEREHLQGDALERGLSYWKEHLADAPPLLQLSTDRPRPVMQTYRGAAEPVILSARISERLKALSQKRGVTIFMILLAAFKTLLHRYTEQEDIVVGTTAANRERSEIEGLVGFFVNMLALRTDCSGNPRFDQLLAQVRETALKAYTHQEVPFERLIQELKPKRNPSYPPLFQVGFSFHNQPTLTDLKLSGLTLSFPQTEITTSQTDLLLDMDDEGEGLTGTLQYNPDLFDRVTIVRMVEHFQNLLEGIVEDPKRRLSELPMLTGAELEQTIADGRHSTREYPSHTCIHQLFEACAEAQPDAVAAIFGGEHLSYAELNRRANQVARFLRSEGVEPGDLVGVCMDHSLEELVGLLGVLKAGAGYLPLDPQHPVQRLAFILADAGVSFVMTQRSYADAFVGMRAISLDAEWPDVSQEDGSNFDAGATAQNVAYVIYTSGSTGEPKGVSVAHESLVNYVWWAKETYLRGERLSFALYSSLAFDLTVTSIFVPLVTGNRVIIYGWGERETPLEQVLRDDRVGVLKLTPSHLTLIKDRDNRGSSVRRLIVGGEAFGTEMARQVYESFGGQVEIFNEYGPTEATVGCMVYQYDPERDRRPGVPIGDPAANVQLYLLSRWQQPTPANVMGELYVAGPGLAQGYLNRPALTAERFIPNPFAPGQRMYRTGDLCRRLPGGELEYLGRRDEQVKFHGYRVELNEIREAMRKHPQVRDCAVMIGRDRNGNELMAAYYVASEELEVPQLRAFLSGLLIAETIPNVFMHMPELPLTRNGKVKYEALPSLEEAQAWQRTYMPPRTPQEERLANIWAEVLGVERVGIDQNFFELGGHSLLAGQIIHRINQTFEVELPMRMIFDDPTVAGLWLSVEESLVKKLEAAKEPA
jgi:amino acid adenylation domain-containing protein